MDTAGVKSGTRVIELLELFEQSRSPLTAAQIARELGYPKSSTSNLLRTLIDCEILSIDAAGELLPTLKLTSLGAWVPEVLCDQLPLDEMVDAVHTATQETATLSVPNGLEMEFVAVAVGTMPIALNIARGTKFSMFGTAVGTAYLSTRTDDEIEALHRRATQEGLLLQAYTDLGEAMREIRLARKRGYAVAYDRVLSDTGALGVPVTGTKRKRTVVLGAGGLSSRIAREEAAIARVMIQARKLGT